jgi:membrane-bound lytic murein transglycosylase B
LIILKFLLAGLIFVGTEATASSYAERSEIKKLVSELVTAHQFDENELLRIFSEVSYQSTPVRLMMPPDPNKPKPVRSWPAYRGKFITDQRIQDGMRFWAQNEEALNKAAQQYGVSPEIIVAIIGVETVFGQNKGSFRTLDTLTTLALDGPRRQEFFKSELRELLLLSRELGASPLAFYGSYAGAVGWPQFMPSSYRRYAVDFDGDGIVNLLDSPTDAIGSVAAYLAEHGWRPGEISAAHVRVPPNKAKALVSGLDTPHTTEQLKAAGVAFGEGILPAGAVSLIELPTPGKEPIYWVGFKNFETITRYNRSTFYAASVVDFARVLAERRAGL